jgi:hypothetical protein
MVPGNGQADDAAVKDLFRGYGMTSTQFFNQVSAGAIRSVRVLRVEGDGTVVVSADDGQEVLCDVLETTAHDRLFLAASDMVLIWHADPQVPRAVVLGRVGLSHAGPMVPDTLILEAKESVLLRVGDGSITIRADGKILIKGKELVSHAQKMNRIKGGAVAIN